MRVEGVLMGLILFFFTLLMFPDLTTAISGVSGDEALKPLLSTIPYLFLAGFLLFSGYMAVSD